MKSTNWRFSTLFTDYVSFMSSPISMCDPSIVFKFFELSTLDQGTSLFLSSKTWFFILFIRYRVYHIEMDETKWLWGIEGPIILLNYGAQCTEVRFASFLSGGFITMVVINPPERKVTKCTSVQWLQEIWTFEFHPWVFEKLT